MKKDLDGRDGISLAGFAGSVDTRLAGFAGGRRRRGARTAMPAALR